MLVVVVPKEKKTPQSRNQTADKRSQQVPDKKKTHSQTYDVPM